jgi:hypothetical protein
MDTTENMTGGANYNKDTYIGFLKIKKGGMKVIPGEMDNLIITKRNNILSKLEKVLTGGDKLKERNIEKYFKALGGKYIRNDMCISGDRSHCKKGKSISMGGAKKLMELASQKYTPDLLETKFRGAAPVLYEKYLKNIGEQNNNVMEGGNYNDVMESGNNDDMGLESLRLDIGRYQYFSGGSNNNIYYNDIELNKLRDEIDFIRNN